MNRNYYFPLLFLRPQFQGDMLLGQYSLACRRWGTSIFDLATLATQHELHLPYQVMDVMLSSCNVELAVHNAGSREDALQSFACFRVGMYLSSVSPFTSPFLTTESINDYSGINERDSALAQGREPKIRSQFTSASGKLEAWPVELSFTCMTRHGTLSFSETQAVEAARLAASWKNLLRQIPALEVMTDAFGSAPQFASRDQSLLHLWTTIESLFPSVNSEVTFRLALYLTILCAAPADRSSFHRRVKAAYGVRSKVAHGTTRAVSDEQWEEAWNLLCECAHAVIRRQGLPSENELLEELFEAGAS